MPNSYTQREESPPALEQELKSGEHHLKEAGAFLALLVAVEILIFVMEHYAGSETTNVVKNIVLLTLGALTTFVLFVVYYIVRVARWQIRNLMFASRLRESFDDIQTRDNIIVPSGADFRVMSVENIRKAPDPIEKVWCKYYLELEESCNLDEYVKELHGCAILFWPSIDDVINSPKYIRYFGSSRDLDFFRVLVTPKPKHCEGLDVYIELARQFGTSIYVIGQDKWDMEIRNCFWTGSGTEHKKEILNLLHAHVEIISEKPIEEFSASASEKWLVRYLHPKEGDGSRDQRARLAREGSDIKTFFSADVEDVRAEGGYVRAAAQFLHCVKSCGAYRDARDCEDIDSLFTPAVPTVLKELVESFGKANARRWRSPFR